MTAVIWLTNKSSKVSELPQPYLVVFVSECFCVLADVMVSEVASYIVLYNINGMPLLMFIHLSTTTW